ncbi:Ig-like domain-containing protein [Rheinheimera sp. 4Y26]|uniref:Ig-like domain-containing protein n=1 Tax=Rheinheimera sp. 4Y26 TaxID=2977811 RepID=UPI0021B0DEE2|nr:Ig-like domain-containing protein [Rheinheimera sp. 4Y26]MCT6698012.1 Ig-like domain-containing protein [Rheinheimera sp. 4Y26]
MFRKTALLVLLILNQTELLQAQEILDPISEKPKVKLSHMTEGFFNLNEKVYFVGRFGQRYSFLQLDPVTNSVVQVAEIPEAYRAWPTSGQYDTGPDISHMVPIGNRLMMGDKRSGLKDWFDPSSGSFYSAFAHKPNAHQDDCRLSGWDNGPILACSVAYGSQNPARKLYYRLERTDGLFHAINDAEMVSFTESMAIENGLFCYKSTVNEREQCSEWPSQTSYVAPEGNSTRVVQHNHIFWLKENGEIVMQQRHSANQTSLSTAAQTTLLNSAGIIAVNSENLLYVVAGTNGENSQIKRLNFTTQRIDIIDLGDNPTEFLDQNIKPWHLTQNRSINSVVDGSFVYRSKLGGIKLLKQDDIAFQLVQADPYVQWDDIYPTAGFIELKDQLVIVGDSCALKDKYGVVFPVPEACAGRTPFFYLTSGQRIQKAEVSGLFAAAETPIRQLTSWNKQLFWYEKSEQEKWLIKRFNPKTQKIDIVREDDFAYSSGKLLAGSSELWLQDGYRGFYRFNSETMKFEFKTALPDAYTLLDSGILHGDHYYFVTSQTKESPYNSFIHRFNLISGQIQTLKTLTNISPYPKLLGVSNNKLNLSFSRLVDDQSLSSGGVLDLSDFTLTFNQALADDSQSGLPTAHFYINETFEFQNKLYALGHSNYRNSLIQLDLANQTRKSFPGSPRHPIGGFERQSHFVFADKLFTSWGQQYAADGSMIIEPLAGSFSHFVHYQDTTYLLSETQLEKLTFKDGMVNSESNLLGNKLLIPINANAIELGGKLYFVARDISNGERIRIIQLPNRPPIAKDDNATTNNSSKITIAVLNNDTDPDFDVIGIQEAKATQGIVSIQQDQQLSYQPKAGFVGIDDIQYQVTDGRGGISTAKVSITVTVTDVPPVTKPEAPAEKSGGSLAFGWLTLLWCAAQFRSRWNSK